MPTPKKTNSKTVAKEVPASKKKTCGKSDCKTAVDLEAPAKKKCCRKKASEPEKAAKPAKRLPPPRLKWKRSLRRKRPERLRLRKPFPLLLPRFPLPRK